MWLRRIIIALYALLFIAVPLLMSTSSSEMFEFPKMMAMYSLALLIASLYVLGLVFGRWTFHSNRLTFYLVLWLVTQTVVTVFSIDWYTSVFGYYGRFNGGLLSTVSYVVLILVGVQVVDERARKLLWHISLTTAVLVFLWGLPGRIGTFDMSCRLFRGDWNISCWTNEFRPQERMFSTLGQPNWLGLYFAIHAIVAGSQVVLHNVTKQYKIIAALLSAVFVFGVWCTGSRSAELGVLAAMATLLVMYISRRIPRNIGAALIVICCVIGLSIGSGYVKRLRVVEKGAITHSGTIRLIVWEGAWKLFEKYPLLGTGPETFAFAYPLTRPADHNLTTEKDFIYNKAHNELLHILATSGAVGFIGYLVLQGFVLYQAAAQKKYGVVGGLIAMHTINFFGFSTSTSQLLWVLLVIDTCATSHSPHVLHHRGSQLNLKTGLGAMAILASVLYGFWYLSLYIGADYAYGRGISLYQSGDAARATLQFGDAYALRPEHLYANRLALAAAQSAYALSKETSDQSTAEDVNYLSRVAISYQNLAVSSSLSNPYYWRDRAKMYVFLSEVSTDEAKLASYKKSVTTSISRAKKLAPTDTTLDDIEGLLK
ncbi:MAG: O-antigen ligase family protein [bacterium]